MGPIFWFYVLTRWLHVTCAVIAVGAFVSMRLVLLPALAGQTPAARQAVLEPVMRRFKTVIHASLGLLLLTGFYNYYAAIPKVRALGLGARYHPIIGTKILLALVLFGMAAGLLSSSAASANMGEGRSRSLTIILILALVILFLSAILRRLWA